MRSIVVLLALVSPARAEDLLSPGPGRVSLQVESAGPPQDLALQFEDTVEVDGVDFRVTARLCTTPCTVFLRPGRYVLRSRGPGLVTAYTPIDLGPGGARVKLKAPNATTQMIGVGMIAVGVAGIVASGAAMLIDHAAANASAASPRPAAHDSTPALVGGGVGMGIGAALVVVGAVLTARARGGAAEIREGTLHVQLAPARDGGSVGVSVRF